MSTVPLNEFPTPQSLVERVRACSDPVIIVDENDHACLVALNPEAFEQLLFENDLITADIAARADARHPLSA